MDYSKEDHETLNDLFGELNIVPVKVLKKNKAEESPKSFLEDTKTMTVLTALHPDPGPRAPSLGKPGRHSGTT